MFQLAKTRKASWSGLGDFFKKGTIFLSRLNLNLFVKKNRDLKLKITKRERDDEKSLGERCLDGIGVDPVQKVGNASVNSRETRLGALVAERNNAHLCPASVLI